MSQLLRCPKCKSRDIIWNELYIQPMCFWQNESGIDPQGFVGSTGDIIGLAGGCRKCQHKWHPRKIKMVTKLPGYPNE